MGIHDLLNGRQVAAVLDIQFGDTGKGKLSDYLSSQWADVTARGTGGNNAGHTVVIKGKEFIFHLLPAGIAYDGLGKKTILGNGMAIDIKSLCDELDLLEKDGGTYNHLMISRDAHVTMPGHIAEDKSENQSQLNGGIGTTGRGIGPTYAAKIARKGIPIGDLLDRDVFANKIKKIQPNAPLDEIIALFTPYIERIRPMVRDTRAELFELLDEGKKVVLEGAQGLLLSIEHGTYPYVTSSDCSLNGTASGVGISAANVDICFNIVKFPFMTRVGAGPFPTEFGGMGSELHCAMGKTKKDELLFAQVPFEELNGKIKYDAQHPSILKLISSTDPLEQGIGLRLIANEYGATTGRPRRIGWTDAVAATYGSRINQAKRDTITVLTKVDCFSGLPEFKICRGYDHRGKVTQQFRSDCAYLRSVQPVYKTYEGYGSLEGIKSFDRLPTSLKQSIRDFEILTKTPVQIVSTGPEQQQTIVRDEY